MALLAPRGFSTPSLPAQGGQRRFPLPNSGRDIPTTPAGLAQATGLPAAEAAGLLRRKQWREGDLAALRAVADRLGLAVRLESLDPGAGKDKAT
jgi:hypothetical protein